MEALYACNRDWWFEVNKPFGWEVCDLRYGAALKGIDRSIMRVTQYLDGKVDCLPELEAERLYFEGKPGPARNLQYHTIVTAGHWQVQ